MIEHEILEYVANSIWQVPMLAAVAWLLVWLGKPGVRAQHRIWLMALLLCVLLPLMKWTEFAATPKQRMADMQRKLEEATRKFERSETQRELRHSPQKLNAPQVPSGKTSPDLP